MVSGEKMWVWDGALEIPCHSERSVSEVEESPRFLDVQKIRGILRLRPSAESYGMIATGNHGYLIRFAMLRMTGGLYILRELFLLVRT